MAKFNKSPARPVLASPVRSERVPSGRTHEGAPGYARDAKSELFLLAVTNMVGEQTFYETASGRDDRFAELVRDVAVADAEWTARFLAWLRSGANLRSASLVGGLEAARAIAANGVPGGRQIVNSVLQRADEPGEALAYWTASYGRSVPKPVKRGIADAAARLYNERSLLKYDTASKGFRFGDVLNLVHAAAGTERQRDLFQHALDRRYGRDESVPGSLAVIAANRALRSEADSAPEVMLDPDRLREAGMTWEDALSLAGSRLDKGRLWSALIPSMGYMALLRNLRNFDEAGVPDEVAAAVAARLADPAEVERSRQLPMRFLSAYRAAPSLRWGHALEQALDHSLASVPELPGRTLVLVDTSGSMNSGFSRDGTLKRWDAATVFGLALARRCEQADVVSFSNGWGGHPGSMVFPRKRGESLLRAVDRWKDGGFFIGGGTDTEAAVRGHYRRHDRVVILTDEQAHFGGEQDVTTAVPADRMVYTWNLAGYRHGHAPSGTRTRHTFGGLTDAAFAMIGLLEAGRDADWPF
ncbi:TROVE domain-containing protein [Glycomyces terrestris]|uniref:TROVE domain-containing protein n=1 Tax=Glycomyces terrestris TaxID=2493553 RepID=A0A426UTF4_9ACTN|nr:TROVE domain-containing protein [Glycomyces terrestris]RRR97273.1 TROVE domain-containing protein [Glycomyces terrestris]